MNHWYARLHARGIFLFIALSILGASVAWWAFSSRPAPELHLIRKGVAAGALAGLVAGLVVAAYTRVLVQGRVRRAQASIRVALNDDDQDPHFVQDEMDLEADQVVDGIGMLRERIGRLEQETARLSVLLSGMTEAVVMTDERERVLVANPVAEALLELPAGYVGRRLADVCKLPEVADLVANSLWNAAPEVRDIEYAVRPVDRRHASVSCAPILDEDRRAVGAVVVLYDVTRLRRLERVRRDFVANVSHELRTPIATIRSASETLLMENMNVDPIARDFVETIFRNAKRMAALVEDLLTLSKLEAAGEEFARVRVDVPTVVADVVERFSPMANDRGVKLDVDLPDELPAMLGEPRSVAQVMQNLVENGVKYTPAGGRVSITASAEGGRVSVEISDTGMGIPPEHIHRVFERFYRVDEGRSRDVGGTGLGLAIAKHLVRKLGGDIDVASTLGRGSVFTFWLPEYREDATKVIDA